MDSRPAPPGTARVARLYAMRALFLLAAAALAGLGAYHLWPARRPEPVVRRTERGAFRVDLNAAAAWELELLPGIGPARAARIVEYRERHGPFRRVEDLRKIPGIGDRMVEALRSYVTVSGREGREESGYPRE